MNILPSELCDAPTWVQARCSSWGQQWPLHYSMLPRTDVAAAQLFAVCFCHSTYHIYRDLPPETLRSFVVKVGETAYYLSNVWLRRGHACSMNVVSETWETLWLPALRSAFLQCHFWLNTSPFYSVKPAAFWKSNISEGDTLKEPLWPCWERFLWRCEVAFNSLLLRAFLQTLAPVSTPKQQHANVRKSAETPSRSNCWWQTGS